MLKKVSPWHVMLFAIASLLAGFLFWRGAPDTVKIAGSIVAVLITFLATALGKDDSSDGKGGAMTALLVASCLFYASIVQACTPLARDTAIADGTKLAVCAATKCSDSPDPASFGVCMASQCARELSPEDVLRLFSAQAGLKRAGCAAPPPTRDAGAEGGAR